MRRILIVVSLMLAGLSSCGATLTLRGTGPDQLNSGSCAAPVLFPAPAWPMFLHFAWSGPASGEDSVACLPGEPVSLTRTLPPGLYTIRGWATVFPYGGPSCDTTITRTAGDRPHTPVIQ